MSGRKEPIKTLTVREFEALRTEARRGVAAERRAKSVADENSKIKAELAKESKRNDELKRKLGDVNAQIKEITKNASDTKKKLLKKIEEANNEIAEQSREFDKKIKEVMDENADAIKKNNERIAAAILDIETKTDARINNVAKQVATLEVKVGDPQAVIAEASDCVAAAKQVTELVEKNFRCQLLCPGMLVALREAISEAEAVIAEAVKNPAKASAAFVEGKNAFKKAEKFYEEIIKAENIWQLKVSAARCAVESAKANVDLHKVHTTEGIDPATGEKKKKNFDTNEMTGGALSELECEVKSLESALADDKVNDFTVEELEGVEKVAENIKAESENVHVDAVEALKNSYERNKIVAAVADGLCKKCLLEVVKEDSGYEGDNHWASNQVRLKNDAMGFDAVINLSPIVRDGNLSINAETTIISNGKTAQIAEDFEKALKEIMEQKGFAGSCSIPVTPELKEAIKDWRKRQNVKVINKKEKRKETVNN